MSNFYIADWHYNHKNCLAFGGNDPRDESRDCC